MHLYSISVYETLTHFYIIGSDVTKTRFNTLKIDRTSEKDFIAGEPDHDYSQTEVGELLATVSSSSSYLFISISYVLCIVFSCYFI